MNRISRIAVLLLLSVTTTAVVAGEVTGIVHNRSKDPATPVVVWIEGPKSDPAALKKPVIVAQTGLQFDPRFVTVARGQVVQFPNRDNTAHSVFSASQTKSFDLGIFAEDERRSIIADRAGLIEVRCALHERMAAQVLVVPSTFFMTIDASGEFSFSGVPAGNHQIVLWRPNTPPVTKEISVTLTGVTRVEF